MKKLILIITFVLIILISGCINLDSDKKNNKNIKDNSENFKVEGFNSDRVNIKYSITKIRYPFANLTSYSDNEIKLIIISGGHESGCYYSYDKPKLDQINNNTIEIKMKNTEEIKERYKDNMIKNCAQYAKSIKVFNKVTINGKNLNNVEKIVTRYKYRNDTVTKLPSIR